MASTTELVADLLPCFHKHSGSNGECTITWITKPDGIWQSLIESRLERERPHTNQRCLSSCQPHSEVNKRLASKTVIFWSPISSVYCSPVDNLKLRQDDGGDDELWCVGSILSHADWSWSRLHELKFHCNQWGDPSLFLRFLWQNALNNDKHPHTSLLDGSLLLSAHCWWERTLVLLKPEV